MRITATFAFALGAMLMAGCAHSPPPAPEPPPGHQAAAPPPAPTPAPSDEAPSANLRLQVEPRPGWVALPSSAVPDGIAGVLINPAAHAMLMVVVAAPATSTARADADTLRGQLSSGSNAWTCSPVTAWPAPDGSTFTLSRGTDRGKVTVRRMHEGPAVNVAFMGHWPAAGAQALRADYDAMVSGATLH